MTYKIEIEIKESTVNEIFSNFTYPYPCWIDHEYNYLAHHDKTRFIIKEADDNGWVYEKGSGKKHAISIEMILKGIGMVAMNNPRLYEYIANDDLDPEVADAVLQYAVFGYIKYG